MNNKILVVDDDVNILQVFQRNLRKHYEVSTAENPVPALKFIDEKGPFAVIISDLRMPGMDGIQFLAKASELYPDTTRIMLTGFADLEASMAAVNEGRIFRFLTKPCPPAIVLQALKDGVRQYNLVTAERELQEKTLRGVVNVLTDVLSMLKPNVYGRISRIIPYVRKLSTEVKDPEPWQTETAAMLAHLGFIVLPEKLINRATLGRNLTGEEYLEYSRHPAVAVDLLSQIPRMEMISKIIAYQEKRYDGTGIPEDDVKYNEIPLGARILKVTMDMENVVSSGVDKGEALSALRRRVGWYDPDILNALERILREETYEMRRLSLAALRGENDPGRKPVHEPRRQDDQGAWDRQRVELKLHPVFEETERPRKDKRTHQGHGADVLFIRTPPSPGRGRTHGRDRRGLPLAD